MRSEVRVVPTFKKLSHNIPLPYTVFAAAYARHTCCPHDRSWCPRDMHSIAKGRSQEEDLSAKSSHSSKFRERIVMSLFGTTSGSREPWEGPMRSFVW